jgi:hypothetical protein
LSSNHQSIRRIPPQLQEQLLVASTSSSTAQIHLGITLCYPWWPIPHFLWVAWDLSENVLLNSAAQLKVELTAQVNYVQVGSIWYSVLRNTPRNSRHQRKICFFDFLDGTGEAQGYSLELRP